MFQQFIESGYDPRSELASSCALKIDPTNDAVAYDYNAAANFHLHKLPEAERSALRAAEIDKSNADPRVG